MLFGGGNGLNDHAKLKFENKVVKQNRKLIHKYCFRFLVLEPYHPTHAGSPAGDVCDEHVSDAAAHAR